MVGSNKPFHNFTRKLTYKEPSARRNITSFSCNGTFSQNGITFLRFSIVGQSFLYHQIRKMIGLVIAICRDGAPPEVIPSVFESYYGNWYLPLAPGEFLYLVDVILSMLSIMNIMINIVYLDEF